MPSLAVFADAKQSGQRLIKTILLVVLLCFTHIQDAYPIGVFTVTQVSELTFGKMQIPGGAVTDIISTAGAQSGTGTLLYGTFGGGEYTIQCSGCLGNLTISIASASLCTGLTSLGSWQGNYNNGAKTGALPFSGLAGPGAGSLDFKVGSTATYTSSVSAGTCTPTFTISISDSFGSHINQTENASIGFDVGLTLNKLSDINFGTVTALNASTYRISPAGAVSIVSGTGTQLYGATAAGNITIVGSTTDGINISVGGYTANNGVTPSNAQCSYNGGGAAACTMTGVAPGSGKTLLVGVDVAANGTQAAGTTAAPSFTISVAYQ